MTFHKALVVAALLLVPIASGADRAQPVVIHARSLLRRAVVVRDITPRLVRPVRYAYGRAVSLGSIVAAVGAIHNARAVARLDSTLLAEARALYRAPYHISKQKFVQAQAKASESIAKLTSDEGILRSRYGNKFTAALLKDRRLVARIDSGNVSVVEVMLPLPALRHPPRVAMACSDDSTDDRSAPLPLRFLGIGGHVPSGMIGQSLFYLGPELQAGALLRVRLRLELRVRYTVKLPTSAVIFDGRKIIAFRKIKGNTFESFQLSHALPFYSHGHIAGYQSVWTGHDEVAIAVKGVGLLWALRARTAGKR